MSVNLADAEWHEFFIGGKDGLFHISSTSSGIDKNKLNTGGNNEEDSNVPYITRTDEKNGINLFIPESQEKKYKKNDGGVITIGLDTQTIFYQPHTFFTGQNIQILHHKRLDKWNGLFLIPLLKKQMDKFNWGGNGATLGRLSRTKIMLPINEDGGLPNWQLMESYTKAFMEKKKAKYIDFCRKELEKLKPKKIVPFEDKEWHEFFLKDIFKFVQRGKRLTKENQTEGNYPYVSSTAMNNGVDNFIGNEDDVRIFSNCITIANSGSVGASFYHPYKFVASDHVTHLQNDNFDRHIYLFIATLTNRLSNKYNFNREINDKRISRDKVMLPINDDGEPDFEYMGQYMMYLEYQKRNQYLDYIQSQS